MMLFKNSSVSWKLYSLIWEFNFCRRYQQRDRCCGWDNIRIFVQQTTDLPQDLLTQ